MTETNTLRSELPVCLESIPALEQVAVDAPCNSYFLAAVPKTQTIEFTGASHAATEVFPDGLIDKIQEGFSPEADVAPRLNDPAGSVRVCGKLGFDVHWLREIVPGKLDGVSGLRIVAEEPFEAWVETHGDRDGKGAWVVLPPVDNTAASPLLMSLMGIHPLEWVWSLWTEIGGPAWKSLASEAQVRTSDLEEFPRVWTALGTAGRARLWQAADNADDLEGYTAELDEEVSRPGTPVMSAARDALRILTATNLRRLFLYVRAMGAQQFETQRIGNALTHWDEYARLHPWIRRRLGALLNVTGSDLWPAVQRRAQVARTLELRIRGMVRGLIAARLAAASDPIDHLDTDFYISLHLPFFDRKKLVRDQVDWTNPTLIAAGSTTLIVCTAREKPMLSITETEVAQTLATPFRMAEAAGTPQEGELVFSYRRTAEPGWRNPFWSAILASYGFPEDTCERDAILTVTLPIEALQAWSRIPPTRESTYIPPMSRMAQAIQRTLRQWAPALHFTSIGSLSDLRADVPLLVYSCVEPFAGRSRCHFTYDPADPSDMQRALRSAGRRLQPIMGVLVQQSEDSGLSVGAEETILGDAHQIIRWVARHPRPTGTLLSTEAFVIEEFIRIVDMLRELKAMLMSPTSNTVRQLAHFIEDFVVVLNRRLRRVHGTDCSVIAPLLLLQATAALRGDIHPTATLTVERNGRTTTYQSPRTA